MTTTRPTRLSAALAVGIGWLAVLLLSQHPMQRVGLGVQLVGLSILLVGVGGWVSTTGPDHPIIGAIMGAMSAVIVLVGGGIAIAGHPTISAVGEFIPGYVGVLVLTLGVARVHQGTERALVTAGTSLILIGIGMGAIFYSSSVTAQLAAGVAAIVAWDLGEQAVNLGEHVGRQPQTHQVELAHCLGTLAVGILAISLALGVRSFNITDIPLAALLVLLAAGLTLAVSLYN